MEPSSRKSPSSTMSTTTIPINNHEECSPTRRSQRLLRVHGAFGDFLVVKLMKFSLLGKRVHDQQPPGNSRLIINILSIDYQRRV